MSDQNTIRPDILTDETKIFILSAAMNKIAFNKLVFFFQYRHGNRLVWFFCRLCLFWCGVNKVTVKGKLAQESKEAPVVVVAPHSSHLDGFVLSALHRTFSAVTRIENIKAPVFGSKLTNLLINLLFSLTMSVGFSLTVKLLEYRLK